MEAVRRARAEEEGKENVPAPKRRMRRARVPPPPPPPAVDWVARVAGVGGAVHDGLAVGSLECGTDVPLVCSVLAGQRLAVCENPGAVTVPALLVAHVGARGSGVLLRYRRLLAEEGLLFYWGDHVPLAPQGQWDLLGVFYVPHAPMGRGYGVVAAFRRRTWPVGLAWVRNPALWLPDLWVLSVPVASMRFGARIVAGLPWAAVSARWPHWVDVLWPTAPETRDWTVEGARVSGYMESEVPPTVHPVVWVTHYDRDDATVEARALRASAYVAAGGELVVISVRRHAVPGWDCVERLPIIVLSQSPVRVLSVYRRAAEAPSL